MDVANAGGSAVRADLNLALVALASLNSGATAPSTTFAYQLWADTTTGILKQRNGANSAWISLLTLATGMPIATTQIQPITASVAASALTATLNPTSLDFRSSALTSGAVTTLNVPAAISVVAPNGATLGTVSAVQSRIAVLAINASGTVELAIVNLSGGNNLDETTLISTTAISAGATSANVIYSTTGRASVPFRVVGYIESTQGTAGVWATAPSTIQGMGGQALAAMSSLGYSQTVQNVTGSRALGTTYYNTTGRPIAVAVTSSVNNIGNAANLTINGQTYTGASAYISSASSNVFGIVPPGGSYSSNVSSGGVLTTWHETR